MIDLIWFIIFISRFDDAIPGVLSIIAIRKKLCLREYSIPISSVNHDANNNNIHEEEEEELEEENKQDNEDEPDDESSSSPPTSSTTNQESKESTNESLISDLDLKQRILAAEVSSLLFFSFS